MEFDPVDWGQHPHPLLFERDGKCGGVCSRCGLPLLRKQSFRCPDSGCNFQIHQSCIHLPGEIQSHFHPQHPLSLRSGGYFCKVCGEELSIHEGYKCEECGFCIDIKCAIANKNLRETSDGKYLHISHPQHPLTLALSPPLEKRGQNTGKIIKKLFYYCVVCELPIQSGSSIYFCSQCDDDDDNDNVHFHKSCAELPMQEKIQDHPHPLSLLKARNLGETPCHVCRNECLGFMYSCLECWFFNVHIPCLKSFNHEHDFMKLRVIIEFQCRVCGEKSKDRYVSLCSICHSLVHEECAEFSSTMRIYEHHHDLTYFKYYFPDGLRHCEICGKMINYLYAGYGCSECNYFSHFKCAQRRCVESVAKEVATEKEAEQHLNIIHPHRLTEFGPEELSRVMKYRVCDGCMKCLSVSGPSYGCSQCDFYLHEECAKLPAIIKTRVIHRHILTLISTPNSIFECEACRQRFHGFAYQCETCLFTVDVRCASIQTSFLHPNHPHTLFLYEPESSRDHDRDACDACGKEIVGQTLAFQCVKPHCKFHLDLRCATLPVEVRYRFDQHPLYLTFFEEEEGEEKEYYCDICEEEREPWLRFYRCRKCNFDAHESCALGEFPFVKSAMHKSHRHPLNRVTKLRNQENGRGCGACNNGFFPFEPTFECRACKFDVHGVGPCYDSQLLEGNLVFTNYNVFSRANQPYEKSIQNLAVKELGPFPPSPNWNGKPWKEKFFSTITAFVIHSHEPYGGVMCIQFQYRKNGEMVWLSKHGKEDGTKHEVCFDYPDEYLVQIRGGYVYRGTLTSLSIESNRKIYGPFGRKEDHHDDFKFSDEDREIFGSENGENIIGIFGTINKDDVLESIGFHYISINE